MKKILSVDGGGVRGIIPAIILAEIEKITGKKISSLFDCITGNSTGGLIALGLAANNENTAQLSASDLVNIYLEKSKDIFKPSIFRKIYTGFGLWGSRYSRKNYDSILNSIFKDNVLSELECNVFIPSYSLNDKKPIILSNYFAAQSKENDFYLRDVAAATSAAPTYFPPDTFTNLDGSKKIIAADGGLFDNNPELIGIMGAYILFPKVNKKNLFLVSLGTGSTFENNQLKPKDGYIGWLENDDLIGSMIDAESAFSEIFTRNLIPSNNNFRMQVTLAEKNMAMDNSSESNLHELETLTRDFIKNNKKNIDTICKNLLQ